MVSYGIKFKNEVGYEQKNLGGIAAIAKSHIQSIVNELYGIKDPKIDISVKYLERAIGLVDHVSFTVDVPNNGFSLETVLGRMDRIWRTANEEGMVSSRSDYAILYNGIEFPVSGYFAIDETIGLPEDRRLLRQKLVTEALKNGKPEEPFHVKKIIKRLPLSSAVRPVNATPAAA